MTTRRKIIILAVILLPVLVLSAVASLFLISQARKTFKHIDVITADVLKKELQRDVKIGSVKATPFGTIIIDDVQIAGDPQIEKDRLLSASRIIVKYRFIDLLRRRLSPVQSISSVRIEKPDLLLQRSAKGEWNISYLLKPRPPGPPFQGVVVIVDGTVTLRDHLAMTPNAPAVNRLKNVNAVIDAKNAPHYLLELSGQGTEERIGNVRTMGTGNTETGTWNFDISAADADASYWTRYFSKPQPIMPTRGLAQASFTVTYRGGLPPDQRFIISGAAKVNNADLSITGLREPIRQVSGNVALTKDTVAFSMNGAIASSPIFSAGTITDFHDPKVNIQIKSGSLNYERLSNLIILPKDIPDFKVAGNGPLGISINGRVSDFAVDAEGTIPSIEALGYQATKVKIGVEYQGDKLQISHLSANVLDGKAILAGTVFFGKNPRLDLSGRATGIPLASLPIPTEDIKISGEASGQFAITGTIKQPSVALNVQLGTGILDTVRFDNASSNIVISGNKTRINGLSVAIAGGIIRAEGTISDGSMQIDVSGSGVDLASLSDQIGLSDYKGRAYIRGVVTGPFQDPSFTGRAEIFNGRFAQIAFDYARGRIVASKNQVELSETTLRVFPSEIIVSGKVTDISTKKPQVDLAVRVSEAQAIQVMRLLQISADVTGLVSGSLNVAGTPPDVVVTGNLALRDGTAAGFPISGADAAIIYEDGVLAVNNLVAHTDGTTVLADGTIDEKRNISFKFSVTDLALSYFNRFTQPYAVLGGTVDTSTGFISGNIDDPSISLALQASDFTINTERFSGLQVAGTWHENQANITELSLARDNQKLTLDHVAVNTATDEVALTGKLSNMNVSTLVEVFYDSPYVIETLKSPDDSKQAQTLRAITRALPDPLEGSITIDFSASGKLPQLSSSFKGALTDLTLAQAKVSQVDLALRTQDGSVIVEDLSTVAKEATIIVQPGVVYSDGVFNVDISITNIDVATLGELAGRHDTQGIASIDASIQGPLSSPKIIASLEVVQPQIAGMIFDRIRASRIEAEAETINVSDVIITSNGHSATAYGTIPWNWAELRVPEDRPLDFHAALTEQDLTVFAILTKAIVEDGTSGKVEAVLDVGGTIKQPDVSGYFAITDGRLSIAKLLTPLENIQARLEFDQDKLVVKQFTGASTEGGTFAVQPGSEISLAKTDAGLPVDIAFQTKELILRAQNALSYGETVNLTVDSSLDVTGNLMKPVIAGNVNLHDGNFAVIPPEILPEIAGSTTFDPQFNIDITLGKNVEFINPRIRAFVVGSASIQGSLTNPNITGEFQVPKGDIRLPTSKFRLQPGSTVALRYVAPEPARLSVNMEGTTRLSAISPLGTPKHYTVVMSVGGSIPPADDLRIKLRSDPPDLPESRILAMLGHAEDLLGGGEVELKEELAEIFTAVAIPSLFDPIESAFLEAFGLTEFEIEYTLRQPLAFLATREIAPHFYVTYWRSITAQDVDYWLKFSYEVFGRYRLSYINGLRSGSTIEAAATFQF